MAVIETTGGSISFHNIVKTNNEAEFNQDQTSQDKSSLRYHNLILAMCLVGCTIYIKNPHHASDAFTIKYVLIL